MLLGRPEGSQWLLQVVVGHVMTTHIVATNKSTLEGIYCIPADLRLALVTGGSALQIARIDSSWSVQEVMARIPT